MDESKPHKGSLKDWRIHYIDEEVYGPCGLGYLILGIFVDHPRFAGRHGQTSWIEKHEGQEIETRNSRYTLIGEELATSI